MSVRRTMLPKAVSPLRSAAAVQRGTGTKSAQGFQRILVVNCGSSSLKYAFYETKEAGLNLRRARASLHASSDRQQQSRHHPSLSALARGSVERIGIDGTELTHRGPNGKLQRHLPKADLSAAFKVMVEELASEQSGSLRSLEEVTLVAHRVVHGGERFTKTTLLNREVVAEIEKLNTLAPLHNPLNLAGIHEMSRLLPDVPQVAVFDTAFHHTLPPHAYLYGLPYEYYVEKAVRRYGFHGTSHQYVSVATAEFLGQPAGKLRIISCHLGNGSSVCAIENGRSLDTSMGFTPGEGLIMGTRCGDVDSGIIAFLERTEGRTAAQTEALLNHQSGLLGLSGASSDMRDVLEAAAAGDPRARLAFDAYCYRVRKYIGAYVAALKGVDAVVFTGGIGQGSAEVRALSLHGLEYLGLKLEEHRNREARGFEVICRISARSSKVQVLVVPADEEKVIAGEALRLMGFRPISQRCNGTGATADLEINE